MTTNMEALQCQICSHFFQDLQQLNDHIETHSKKELYQFGVSLKNYLEILIRENTVLKAQFNHLKQSQLQVTEEQAYLYANTFNVQSSAKDDQGEVPIENSDKVTVYTEDQVGQDDSQYRQPDYVQEVTVQSADAQSAPTPESVPMIDLNQEEMRNGPTSPKAVESEDEVISCCICKLTFPSYNLLNNHIQTHIDSNSFACPVCQKVLNSRNNLLVHIRIHTGEKPYKCRICGKPFTQYGTLYRHKKKHEANGEFEKAGTSPRGGDMSDAKSNHSTKSTETADSPVIVEDANKQVYQNVQQQQQLSYPPNVMLSPNTSLESILPQQLLAQEGITPELLERYNQLLFQRTPNQMYGPGTSKEESWPKTSEAEPTKSAIPVPQPRPEHISVNSLETLPWAIKKEHEKAEEKEMDLSTITERETIDQHQQSHYSYMYPETTTAETSKPETSTVRTETTQIHSPLNIPQIPPRVPPSLDVTHPEYSLNLLTSQAVLANPNYILPNEGGAAQNADAVLEEQLKKEKQLVEEWNAAMQAHAQANALAAQQFHHVLPQTQPENQKEAKPSLANNQILESFTSLTKNLLQKLNKKEDQDDEMAIDNADLKCSVCNLTVTSYEEMKSHIKSHNKHTCDICQKSFSTPFVLRRHRMIHTGERPHVCSICGKSFIEKQHLTCHMRTHTGDKPYKCKYCPKRFAQRSSLQIHQKVHQRGEGKRSSTEEAEVNDHNTSNEVESSPEAKLNLSEQNILELRRRLSFNEADLIRFNQNLAAAQGLEMLRPRTKSVEYPPGEQKSYWDPNIHNIYGSTPAAAGNDENKDALDLTFHSRERSLSLNSDGGPSQSIDLTKTEHNQPIVIPNPSTISSSITLETARSADEEYEKKVQQHILQAQQAQAQHLAQLAQGQHQAHAQQQAQQIHQQQQQAQTSTHQSSSIPNGQEENSAETTPTSSGGQSEVSQMFLQMAKAEKSGDSPYTCHVCGKTLSTLYTLRNHIQNHYGHKPFSCDECGKTFSIKTHLITHTRVHTGEKPYICQCCGKHFQRYSAVQRHLAYVHKVEKGVKGRDYVIVHSDSAKDDILQEIKDHEDGNGSDHEHQESENESDMPMPQTSSQGLVKNDPPVAPPKNGLNSSMDESGTESSGSKEEQVECHCTICNLLFQDHEGLTKHLGIVHTGGNNRTCEICGKSFTVPFSLKRHLMIHMGVKPHKCTECGKRFTEKQHLESHQRVHTGERPFKCHICRKVFSQSGTLQNHIKKHFEDQQQTTPETPRQTPSHEQFLNNIQYQMMLARAQMAQAQGGIDGSLALSQIMPDTSAAAGLVQMRSLSVDSTVGGVPSSKSPSMDTSVAAALASRSVSVDSAIALQQLQEQMQAAAQMERHMQEQLQAVANAERAMQEQIQATASAEQAMREQLQNAVQEQIRAQQMQQQSSDQRGQNLEQRGQNSEHNTASNDSEMTEDGQVINKQTVETVSSESASCADGVEKSLRNEETENVRSTPPVGTGGNSADGTIEESHPSMEQEVGGHSEKVDRDNNDVEMTEVAQA